MSFISGPAIPEALSFLTIALGALAGASLRFVLNRSTGSDTGARRSWVVESVLAFGLGLLAGIVLVVGSGSGQSPLGLGVLAVLAAYAGTAFAVSWMGQKKPEHAPVVPAAHLLVTLLVSLAGAAAVMGVAGRF